MRYGGILRPETAAKITHAWSIAASSGAKKNQESTDLLDQTDTLVCATLNQIFLAVSKSIILCSNRLNDQALWQPQASRARHLHCYVGKANDPDSLHLGKNKES